MSVIAEQSIENQLKTAVANMRGLKLDAVKRADAISFLENIAPKEILQKALEIAYDGAKFENALRELTPTTIEPAPQEELTVAVTPVAPAQTLPEAENIEPLKKDLPLTPDKHIEDVEEEKPRGGRYAKYVLYDPMNQEHREMTSRRKEWGGFFFLTFLVASEHNKPLDKQLSEHGRLPIGVVKRGEHISAAYLPPENSTDLTDLRWVAQARALRAYADYDDAVYAEWPDLQPCAGELKEVPRFNPEWLPLAIRAHVEDISLRMSVPVDYPAICSISTLAGTVGRRALVYPKANDKGWFEPITISGAVVADSGKKKSPTWKALMRPIHELEKDWEHAHSKKMAEYNLALKAFEQAIKKGVPAVEPEEPKLKRLVLNDSTHEKMHDICKDNPQGLLFERDELSGLVAELDMDGREGMRGFFLDGMTGDSSRTVDRIGREGGQADLTFSVFGSFQPLMFVNVLSNSVNVASGMLPRFHALSWPDKADIPRVDAAENQEAKARYRNVARALGSLEDKSVFLHFTGDAQQLFYQFQNWLDELMDSESNPGKQSHLSKLEGGVAKIAALFQLIDAVAALPLVETTSINLQMGDSVVTTQPGTIKGNLYIDEQHFQMAWNLVRYLVAHMHRVYDSKLEGIEYRKVRLIEHLKDGSIRDGMTANEIHHKDWAGLSRKVASADAIQAALEELVPLGWVRPIPVKPGTTKPGKPTVRWEVNPDARRVGESGDRGS